MALAMLATVEEIFVVMVTGLPFTVVVDDVTGNVVSHVTITPITVCASPCCFVFTDGDATFITHINIRRVVAYTFSMLVIVTVAPTNVGGSAAAMVAAKAAVAASSNVDASRPFRFKLEENDAT